MLKKLKDKRWRLNNLYRIKDKDGNIIRFRMNSAQSHFFDNRHNRNIILKDRQLGFTTFEIIDQFDDILFSTDKLFATSFVAHKKDDAEKIFYSKMKFAWERLPESIKSMFKIVRETSEDFKIDLGGGHINEMQVSVSVRSGTNQRIHISELSYVDQKDPRKSNEIIRGAIPSLASGGMLTIESTARGLTGNFHDIFMKAWKRTDGTPLSPDEYKAHFYNFTWDDYELGKITDELIKQYKDQIPEFIEELAKVHGWSVKEKTCYYSFYLRCNGDMDFLKQEYPITVEEAFEGSVENIFKSNKVNSMPEKVGRKEGNWIYYHDYIKGNVYGLGADVAEGIGRDSSTIVIWDFTPLFKKCNYKPQVVATYANDEISPTEFAYQIMAGGTRYGNCLVAPERNNHGFATIGQLRQIYPENNIFCVGMDVTSIKDNKEGRYGFLTTTATKSLMLNEMNDAVNQEIIDVWSKQIKAEMISYDKDDLGRTRKKKDQTNHWDLLIAACIGWQMKRYVRYHEEEEEEFVEVNNDPYE